MNNQGLILYSDSARDVYIPEHFANTIDRDCVKGIDPDVLDWLADCDPYDAEYFWDEWNTVLDNCEVHDRGHVYKLHHDGDLWLYCEALMSEQEKADFFGEYTE